MPILVLRCFCLAVCAAAAVVPLFEPHSLPVSRADPPWPVSFENRPLQELPLSRGEERFNQGFPGAVARFTDGERQFIVRWTTTGTRKLHSSADCFRGLGYRIVPEPPRLDGNGARWGCFSAHRGPLHLRVRERITDVTGSQEWCDVSAWYWSTLLRQSRGPWTAIAVIEDESKSNSRGFPPSD